jgi:hypothetical protein
VVAKLGLSFVDADRFLADQKLTDGTTSGSGAPEMRVFKAARGNYFPVI